MLERRSGSEADVCASFPVESSAYSICDPDCEPKAMPSTSPATPIAAWKKDMVFWAGLYALWADSGGSQGSIRISTLVTAAASRLKLRVGPALGRCRRHKLSKLGWNLHLPRFEGVPRGIWRNSLDRVLHCITRHVSEKDPNTMHRVNARNEA